MQGLPPRISRVPPSQRRAIGGGKWSELCERTSGGDEKGDGETKARNSGSSYVKRGRVLHDPGRGGQRKRLCPERLLRTFVVEVAATAQQGAVTPGAQIDWQAAAETVVGGSEDWQMGNTGVEAAAAAAGGAAEYGSGAAAEAAAGTAAGVWPPRPADWGTMTRSQRHRWKQRGGRPCLDSDRGGI